jgi:hypothetical protein
MSAPSHSGNESTIPQRDGNDTIIVIDAICLLFYAPVFVGLSIIFTVDIQEVKELNPVLLEFF